MAAAQNNSAIEKGIDTPGADQENSQRLYSSRKVEKTVNRARRSSNRSVPSLVAQRTKLCVGKRTQEEEIKKLVFQQIWVTLGKSHNARRVHPNPYRTITDQTAAYVEQGRQDVKNRGINTSYV